MVAGGGEAVGGGGLHVADEAGAEVLEVVLAAAERVDLAGVLVEADAREAGGVEGGQQGQADVAEADHADDGGALFDPRPQLVGGSVRVGGGGGTRGRRHGLQCRATALGRAKSDGID